MCTIHNGCARLLVILGLSAQLTSIELDKVCNNTSTRQNLITYGKGNTIHSKCMEVRGLVLTIWRTLQSLGDLHIVHNIGLNSIAATLNLQQQQHTTG